MKCSILIAIIIFCASCGVPYRFATLKEYENDSSHVYSLPYPPGSSKLVIQGYRSLFSHRGRLSLDFKMKKGSPVTAARGGIVIRSEQHFEKGGISRKFVGKANQVVVRHDDGTFASYGHLQHLGALVSVGDTIKTGDTIGKAGSTGFSALVHLHFAVWARTPQGRVQLPTRFRTERGVEYLRPGKWYKAP